jgi:hypothetical protein
MGVIRFHVKASAIEGYAAIDMTGCIIDQAAGDRTRIVPKQLTRLGIEGERVVRSGEVHDSIHDHGCGFEHAGSLGMKDPLRLQLACILRCDLGEAAKAPTGVVAVVRGPIVLYGLGEHLRPGIANGKRAGSQTTCADKKNPRPVKLHAVNALHR